MTSLSAAPSDAQPLLSDEEEEGEEDGVASLVRRVSTASSRPSTSAANAASTSSAGAASSSADDASGLRPVYSLFSPANPTGGASAGAGAVAVLPATAGSSACETEARGRESTAMPAAAPAAAERDEYLRPYRHAARPTWPASSGDDLRAAGSVNGARRRGPRRRFTLPATTDGCRPARFTRAVAYLLITGLFMILWLCQAPLPWDMPHIRHPPSPPAPIPPPPPSPPSPPPSPPNSPPAPLPGPGNWTTPEVFTTRRALIDLFYSTGGFKTSGSGGSGWSRCDDPRGPDADDTYSNPFRWDAQQHYCTWRCLRCDETGKVTHLRLAETNMQGSLPAALFSSLPSLISVNMSANYLNGELPQAVWKLGALEELDLANNQLSGSLPASNGFNATRLRTVTLEENQLSGKLPFAMLQLPKLLTLNLRGNSLGSSLPRLALKGKSVLRELYVDSNSLTGGVPSELATLTSLETLSLGNNPDLGGSVPAELGGLAGTLRVVQADNAGISGSLPTQLGMMSALARLDLSHNALTQRVPHLSSGLEYLDLSGNSLSGDLPDFSHLASLASLGLSCNQLSLPQSTSGSLLPPGLQVCDLAYNPFATTDKGRLPPWLFRGHGCKADRERLPSYKPPQTDPC